MCLLLILSDPVCGFLTQRLITKGYFLSGQIAHFSHRVTKSKPSPVLRYRLKTGLR